MCGKIARSPAGGITRLMLLSVDRVQVDNMSMILIHPVPVDFDLPAVIGTTRPPPENADPDV
jgi:hypothetical protein